MQLLSLQTIIMGALWASSIGAIGILVYSLLLIALRQSVIRKDLILTNKMTTDIALFHHKKSRVSEAMQNVLNVIEKEWSEQFEAYLSTTTEGVSSIAGVLRPVAPLLGLAGTLFGISDALTYAATDPTLVMEGFAFAIQTTLIGIFVSVVAHITASWIWTPYWNRQRYELYQVLCDLHQSQAPKPRRQYRKSRAKNKDSAVAPVVQEVVQSPVNNQTEKESTYVEHRTRERTGRPDSVYRSPCLTGGVVNGFDANDRFFPSGKDPVGSK